MPSWRRQLRVLHLRELEVGRRRVRLPAPDWAAAVEAPKPEAVGDHIRAPDRRPFEEELASAFFVATDKRPDQRNKSDSVREADDREQDERDVPAMTDPLERPKRRFPDEPHEKNRLRADRENPDPPR